jgi:hypothetical protein
MNIAARRKILTILIVLFLLCVGGLVYWYYFRNRCVSLPKEYEFLNRFIVKDECGIKEFKVKGIVYNIRDEDGKVKFDFNAWNTETRESLYYEGIGFERDDYEGDFEMSEGNLGAVEMIVEMSSSNEALRSSLKRVCRVTPLKFTEDSYDNLMGILYDVIVNGPVSEYASFKGLEEGLEKNKEGFFVTAVAYEDGTYYPYLVDGGVAARLYKPLVLSSLIDSGYANKYTWISKKNVYDAESIMGIVRFDLKNFLMDFEKEMLAKVAPEESLCVAGECGGFLGDFSADIPQLGYQKLGCMLMYEIFNNLNYAWQEGDYKEYCDIDELREISQEVEMDIMDDDLYIDFFKDLRLEELVGKGRKNEQLFFRSEISKDLSFLLDYFYALRLYGLDIEKEDLDQDLGNVVNHLILYDKVSLGDTCLLLSYLNVLKQEGLGSQEWISTREDIINLLYSSSGDLLKLIDENPYYGVLCLDSLMKEEGFEDMASSLVIRIMNMNFWDEGIESNRTGLWMDGEYDIRFNSKYFKLLLENRDKLL